MLTPISFGTEIFVKSSERTIGFTSSRGNQLKWRQGDLFIKLDCLGYEGLAEAYVSKFLQYTNVKEYVKYTQCTIVEDDTTLGAGCYSGDFIRGDTEITFGQILDSNLASYAISYDDLRDMVLNDTGFDPKSYMDAVLCLDAITMNDDRHFNNFALLRNDKGVYRAAPIFDNGGALLSDLLTYPMRDSVEVCMNRVQAKPFSTDFLNQLNFVTPICIEPAQFFSDVKPSTEEEKRAIEVLHRRLKVTKDIAWQEW